MTAAWTPRRQLLSYDEVRDCIARARTATHALAALDPGTRDDALMAVADVLLERRTELLEANGLDVQAAALGPGALARMTLTEDRIVRLADGLRAIAADPDPLGQWAGDTPGTWVVKVPIGVIGVVYDPHPATAVEAAALAVKSGNGVLLRGAPEAARTDKLLVELIRSGLDKRGAPPELVQSLPVGERATVRFLVSAYGLVDLVLLRGGARLIRAGRADATVPLVELANGNCHVYLHTDADPRTAEQTVLGSLLGYEGDPDAVHTVLVNTAVADIVPALVRQLITAGIEVHGDDTVAGLAPGVLALTEEGWEADHSHGAVAIAVVGSLDDAVAHIGQYGAGHTEVIVTADADAARAFTVALDCSSVGVNTPTIACSRGPARLFSTQKVHVRGPVGAPQLTSTKHIIQARPEKAGGPAGSAARSGCRAGPGISGDLGAGTGT